MTTVSPSMRNVIAHFAELGPRWGLKSETCAAHVLIYLVGRPMTCPDIAACLGWDEAAAQAAIDDLVGWRMAQRTRDGLVSTSGKPWDLLSAAFEERRRREIEPALRILADAATAATRDGTPRGAAQRIRSLLDLARDLSTIAQRVGQLSATTMTRLLSIGGRVSRIIGPTRF
jgi:DNA-binding transcriptional regulator GbsR (MarR family)